MTWSIGISLLAEDNDDDNGIYIIYSINELEAVEAVKAVKKYKKSND